MAEQSQKTLDVSYDVPFLDPTEKIGPKVPLVSLEEYDNVTNDDGDDEAEITSTDNEKKIGPYKYNPTSYKRNCESFLGPKIPGLDFDRGWNTWEITDLKSFRDGGKHKGPAFTVGSMEFNVLLTHSANRGTDAFSVFLEGRPIDQKEKNDDDWSCPVKFAFDAWDNEDHQHKTNSTKFRYNKQISDWGFNSFIDPGSMLGSRFIAKNKVNISVYVWVFHDYTHVLFHDFRNYDSKKSTGFIGIENQGATCYLNSLLQSYFFTRNFRDKVYQIPTEDEIKYDLPTYRDYISQPKSVPLSLQRIFYKLQTSKEVINSLELTQSFGWTTADAFEQHDVQELNRILMDKLETKMKGTEIDGCLNDIFVGKMNSFIRCVNVDYESSRTEDFWDIQLNVKGLAGIQQSFENYVALEMLDGDNKYDAGEYGLQNAEKGVIFESFPPVLHIQLKRYEYDFNYDQMVKINDRYEFTQTIDLKPYLSKSVSNYDEDWEYELHGVLVHQGDVSVGHYYAMIKPSQENKWFKFEDDRVVRVTEFQVFDENFGCNKQHIDTRGMTREEAQNLFWKQSTSAYMLVYIRKNKIAEVLGENDDFSFPQHIQKQIEYENEQELKIKREREQMHLYANIQIFTDKKFVKYDGFDIGPNSSNKITYAPETYNEDSFPLELKVLKSDPVDRLFEIVAENEYGDDVNETKLKDLRFWKMDLRDNDTFRPSDPINCQYGKYKDVTIGEICKLCERRRYQGYSGPTTIYLYLEDLSIDLNFAFNSKTELFANGKFPNEISSIEDYNEKVCEISKVARENFTPSWEVYKDNRHNLIFLKYFDARNQAIRGLGHMIIARDTTFSALSTKIAFLLDEDPNHFIHFAEELNSENILDKKLEESLYQSEIGTGDILCFDRPVQVQPEEYKFKNLLQMYLFISTRRHFKIIQNQVIDENEEDYIDSDENGDTSSDTDKAVPLKLDLWISFNSSYQDIATEIGAKIGREPDRIRLSYLDDEGRHSLRSDFRFDYFAKFAQSKVIYLAYEFLNIPLKEVEELKDCVVFWIGNGICKEERHDFSLPRSTTVDNLLDRLETKVPFTAEQRNDLLVWTVSQNHQLKDVCELDDNIEEQQVFVVGCYPEFKNALLSRSDNEILVTGYHFFQSPENFHSLPFIFKLIKGESFLDMASRLKKILGLSEKEFKNIHIGVANENRIEYLDPKKDTKPFSVFQDGCALILNHPDRNARRGSLQSSIVIRG